MNRSCKQCSSRKITYSLNDDSGRPPADTEINNMVKKGFSMVQSFATSMISRGMTNKKTNRPTKRLRVLSCFGDKSIGGDIAPCEGLMSSNVEKGKFYCGKCGCGDKKRTWLTADGDEYSKLDYPKLQCPLQMPGFTNYKPSENKSDNPRKHQIEQYDVNNLHKIDVTLPVNTDIVK
jgi:hypothetical protein